jgi:hypothetical protein
MSVVSTSMTLSSEDQVHLDEFESLTDLIRDRARSVAERYQVGCYLVGRAGSGKTYTVSETLDDLGQPWILRNSRMSPMGLWCLLEEHPEHTVVLDDISTLFNEVSALQILMAALGGKPGEARTITYTTKDKHERKSFDFYGGIIAISNIALRRDPLADAVASRVVMLEHEPSDEMIAAFMRKQALKGFEDMTEEECLEVVEFAIAETRACDYRLNLRVMEKAWQDYRLDKHGKANRSWEELVKSSLKRIVRSDVTTPARRADRKAMEQELALDLFQRYPHDKLLRDKEWREQTGKAPDSLYRRHRELEDAGRL